MRHDLLVVLTEIREAFDADGVIDGHDLRRQLRRLRRKIPKGEIVQVDPEALAAFDLALLLAKGGRPTLLQILTLLAQAGVIE